MKAILLALTVLLSAVGTAQEAMRFHRLEVPWGQPISLEEFGGPQVNVAVRSRQVSFVIAEIADYTRMVPVIVNDTTIYGPRRVVMQPSRESRRVEKKNGVRAPGGRSDMYRLYQDTGSGIAVYFSDETAGQNFDVVVVGVPQRMPPQPKRSAAPRVVPQRAAAPPDGYLSDTLLDWYLRLEEKRDRLNLNDREAVESFNAEAARYHAEVKRARVAPKQ